MLSQPQNRYSKSLQNEYRIALKSYNKLIRKAKASYQANLYQQLDTLHTSNPTAFWKLYKDINDLEDVQTNNPIDPSTWVDHFTDLLNAPLTVDDSIKTQVDELLQNPPLIFNELNFSISSEEVQRQVKKLKINKAASKDGIINEMIKWSPV